MTRHKSQDERREQILAAARECFIRNGYAHTRVDDIAEAAGLSKGGVYFHFTSKREIFDALLTAQQARTGALLEKIEHLEGPVATRLAELGSSLLAHYTAAETDRRFLIVLAEMGMRDDGVRTRVHEAHKRYVEVITEHVRRGVESGEFGDFDPRSVAMFLKFLIDGIEQAVALGYEFDPEALAMTGIQIIFGGLRRPSGEST
jgi:AcrR family transcriptional regulator